jgi:hypothetical protein
MKYKTVDIGSEEDPVPVLSMMVAQGWYLITSYPINGSWHIKLVFGRAKGGEDAK